MVGGSGGGVGRLWIWEYGRLNGHSRLRSAWRKWLEDLVLEGRLDLLPRERGGGVGGSGVVVKSSARAGGPRAAALVCCGGWGAGMARSVCRVTVVGCDFGDFGVSFVSTVAGR